MSPSKVLEAPGLAGGTRLDYPLLARLGGNAVVQVTLTGAGLHTVEVGAFEREAFQRVGQRRIAEALAGRGDAAFRGVERRARPF